MIEESRVGVFICKCGGNISDTVNVEKVKDAIVADGRAKVVEFTKYVCSKPGQDMIKNAIQKENVNRVVVASCSPRMHLETFRRAVKSAGLNPYLLEMVNLREQCSWVHDDKAKATAKATDIVRGAVERSFYLESLEPKTQKVNRDILVIGGGIAGTNAAIELADNGYKVSIVEKSPTLGGHMAQLSKTFPTLDCSLCILTPKLAYAAQHPNISIYSMSEVSSVEGSPGNYKVKITKHPRYIDEKSCTGCGNCAKECPVELPSEFDMGLGSRKAVSISFAQAMPNAYFIDKKGIPPCKAACPAGVNVQGYLALVSQGKFKEAIELVRRENPLPAVCGRICFHPCEKECERNKIDQPLAVNAIKRFISDYESNQETTAVTPFPLTHTEKVAIIGSGPAGLAAAYELRKMGYSVVVFESMPKAGGMLRYGIPEYRLPKKVLDKEIGYLESLGLEIRTNVGIGKDVSFDSLVKEYSAVFVAVGLQGVKKLKITGEELKGVTTAIEFLRQVSLGIETKVGNRTVIIGGGNVAIDAARTAKRHGAKEVTVVYRRSKEEMPAYVAEVQEAEKEGIKFQFLASPTRIIDKEGCVASLECIKMELGEPDESGRRRPIPINASEFTFDVDTVISAIGQSLDNTCLTATVQLSATNTISVDSATLQTNVPGVFAGGDVVKGEATAIDAIAQGKKVAVSIDSYLKGEPIALISEENNKIAHPIVDSSVKSKTQTKPRNEMPELPVDQRMTDNEVELGFTQEMAIEEAKRCLACGGCSECLECEKVCEAKGVINHKQKDQIIDLDVGSIIVATGFDQINPEKLPTYSFGKHPDIITNLQFERLMIQGMHKPSDGKVPMKVAFVLCAGSREPDEKHGEKHCCKIGCMTSIKQALLLQKSVPEAEPWIFYIDMRADGKGYEEFYMTAQEHGAKFVRGRVSEITPTSKGLFVRAVDTSLNARIEGNFDMVVLSPALISNLGSQDLSRKLGISTGSDDFFMERHFKLKPVDSQREGIYVCGCALGPKDVRESTLEAMATALRASSFLGTGEIQISPEKAKIKPESCNNCGKCLLLCPVKAIEQTDKLPIINPISCVGCGLCVPKCPTDAIELSHSTDEQLIAQIRGITEKSEDLQIVAFLEGTTAYASADLAGQTRLGYSPMVKIISVPSTGRIGLKHITTAFASGADGVILVEGKDGTFTEDMLREHVTQLKKDLRSYGVNPMRLAHTVTTIPQYDKILNIFQTMVERISKMGRISKEERSKINAAQAVSITGTVNKMENSKA